MIDYLEVEINNKKFKSSPLPALKALKLDKKIITMLLPMLSEFKGMDEKLNFGKMLHSLSQSLNEMADTEFEKFIIDILSTTIYMKDNTPPEQITSDKINIIFQGDIICIYKLIFEIMKYNKFSPFELVGGGGEIFKTFFYDGLMLKEKESGIE